MTGGLANRAHLTLRLLRVGRAAGRAAEAGRIRRVALFAATFLLALGLAALAVVHATYEGARERDQDRAPVLVAEEDADSAAVLWKGSFDSLRGGSQFQVAYLTPQRDDAPLPPGLDRWPQAGEAVLSPALLEAGRQEGIAERYGRLAGTIEQEGLAHANEYLAYVRPHHDLTDDQNPWPLAGFGPEAGPVTTSGLDDDKPEWMFQVTVLGLFVLPTMVLLGVAARAGADQRDRRTALITALGGRRRDRLLITLGETWRPAALGGTLAWLPVVGALATDCRLPWIGYTVQAADVRQWFWLALLAPLAAMAAACAVALLAQRLTKHGGRQGGVRPRLRRRPTRWAVLCPIMIFVAVRVPEFFEPATPPYILTNWFGVAGTLLTLPAAVAAIAAGTGRLLARVGRARGQAGTLIAGRRLATHPGPLARMTAGLVIAVCLLLQVFAWQGVFGSQAAAAQHTLDRMGESGLVVPLPEDVDAAHVRRLASELPPGAESVLLTRSLQDDTLVQGTCGALRTLALPCTDAPTPLADPPTEPLTRELARWYAADGTSLVVAARDDPSTALAERGADSMELFVFSRDGSDLSMPTLKTLVHRVFPIGVEVQTLGGQWLVGGETNREHGQWILFFGVLGIGILAIATGTGALAEFLRNGRALAPLSVLTGNRRTFVTIAAWTVLAPMILAGLAGAVVGTWIATPTLVAGYLTIPAALLATCLALICTSSTALWIWGSKVSVHHATTWRPRGD